MHYRGLFRSAYLSCYLLVQVRVRLRDPLEELRWLLLFLLVRSVQVTRELMVQLDLRRTCS